MIFITKPFFATAVMSLLACTTLAEDRRKFYLSVNVGPSYNHLKEQSKGGTVTANTSGLYTSYKIGAHATNEFALYLLLEEANFGFFGGNNNDGLSAAGIGATSYFKDTHGPYIEAAALLSFIGLADWP